MLKLYKKNIKQSKPFDLNKIRLSHHVYLTLCKQAGEQLRPVYSDTTELN